MPLKALAPTSRGLFEDEDVGCCMDVRSVADRSDLPSTKTAWEINISLFFISP